MTEQAQWASGATSSSRKMLAPIGDAELEHDRKTCIELDMRASGANRELAQWLLDHPYYSATVVCGWLGCGVSRVKYLRAWARKGFPGKPQSQMNKRDDRTFADRVARRRDRGDEALETLDNSDAGAEEIASPAEIEENVIYTLQRFNEHARVFKKLFALSSFDEEAIKRIDFRIEQMIEKWRRTQATLTRRRT